MNKDLLPNYDHIDTISFKKRMIVNKYYHIDV